MKGANEMKFVGLKEPKKAPEKERDPKGRKEPKKDEVEKASKG